MLKEFKEFAIRGNVMDLAIAVIIGAAFGAIVTSLINDVLMPPLGLALGHVDFKDLFYSLNGQTYPNLTADVAVVDLVQADTPTTVATHASDSYEVMPDSKTVVWLEPGAGLHITTP